MKKWMVELNGSKVGELGDSEYRQIKKRYIAMHFCI